MRYTKIALLTFGAGLVLGLAVVVVEIDPLDRVASGLMALGLIGVPVGVIVDWRLATRVAPKPAKRRPKASTRRAGTAPTPARRTARPRKPASPKR
jgi:xanthosine utilization system XapX-like protein